MRKIFTLAAASLALAGCATVEVDNSPPLQVVEVISVPGKSSVQLCDSARDWVATSFRDSKAVIEVYDAERGKLIGKGGMSARIFGGAQLPIRFTMTIDCKDERIRAAFDNYLSQGFGDSWNPLMEDSTNRMKTQAEAETRRLLVSLGNKLSSKPTDF
jgi:hypothetical protein